MPAAPSVPPKSLSPSMWRVRRGQRGIGVPPGSCCHLCCGHHLSFLCMWLPPSPLPPLYAALPRGTILAPSQHSSSSSQAPLKLHHQPFPWMCPPACPIPVHVHLHFCSLIRPSIHPPWIHPWLIHPSSNPSLYLCSYLSFHLFLMDPSISFIPAHTHLSISLLLHPFHVDSPITHPSQLTSISPSLLTRLHLSFPCGFNSQHTPISPSPCSSIHLVLVNSPLSHPCQLTSISPPPLTPLHPSLPGGFIHFSPTPTDIPLSVSSHTPPCISSLCIHPSLVHPSTRHLSISSHTLPSIPSLCIIHLTHPSTCPTHLLLSHSASH